MTRDDNHGHSPGNAVAKNVSMGTASDNETSKVSKSLFSSRRINPRRCMGTRSERTRRTCPNMERRAVSPVISTTILISISVVLGLSLWSFSVSESNSASYVIANTTTSYVNYLNDRFTIVHIAYSYDAKNFCGDDSTCLTVWIYNNGDLPTKINEVMFGPKVSSMASMPHSPDSLVIPPKSVGTITIQYKVNGVNTTFEPDTSYIVKLVTETGAFQQYYEKNVG